MKILIAILISVFFFLLLEKQIKKYREVCYVVTLLLGVLTGVLSDSVYPEVIRPIFSDYLQKGILAAALFVIVMFAPLMPKKSRFIRVFMGLRGEIAIMASFLLLSHIIRYGKDYVTRYFLGENQWQIQTILTVIVCAVMIALLIPLAITSFQRIRRKMNARRWKKLQRSSYLFYALIYIHVAVLYLPRALSGNAAHLIDMCIYSLIFGSYTVLRLRKYLLQKKRMKAAQRVMAAGFLTVTGCLLALVIPSVSSMGTGEQTVVSHEVTVSENTEETKGVGSSTYKDGTYTGEGNGFNGVVKNRSNDSRW